MCECMCAFRFIFIRVNFSYVNFQVDQELHISETKYIKDMDIQLEQRLSTQTEQSVSQV